MKRLLRNVLAAFVVSIVGVSSASAQASYNFQYTEGVTVAAGGDYFLYNIGSGMFLTDGMDWGTHATADHAGRLITLASLNDGKYSIYTQSYSVNNDAQAKAGYMTTNGFLDTGTNDANWEFTPVTVSGYTNTYTIKNSDTQYLYFNAADARVNVGESPNNNYAYWILVPKTARDEKNDYTYYLMNTDFNRPWERRIWSKAENNDNVFINGGLAANLCAERYHGVVDIYQTISQSVPEGRYRLYAQAFWRQDGSDAGAVLYANSDTQTLAGFNANGEGTAASRDGASTAFTAGQYVNNVETFVNDGSLRVGINITSGSQWVIWDNFTLQYLGKVVMDYATELSSDNMTADTWYYFDITIAGEYQLTATTLSDIKYTTDGYTLTTATPSDTWSSATQTLAVGRYYVKSTSAQTLTVEAASYSYTVGTATKDRTYVQPGNVVTVAYPNAVTNSGEALTINTSNIRFNGAALANATTTANGFTFEIPAGLTTATDYTLSIPAGAVGYAAGATYNEAQSITLKTPAVFDGTYYLKVAKATTDLQTANQSDAEGKYLSRGDAWGTHATLDKYGLALQISTDANNYSILKVFDTQCFYYHGGTYQCWADGTGGTGDNEKFIIDKQLGYLTICPFYYKDNKHYFKYNTNEGSNDIVAMYDDGPTAGPIILWELESPADHATVMAGYKDAQAAAAAAAAYDDNSATYASLSSITTVAAMETAAQTLDNFVVVGGEAPTSVQEKYQGTKPNHAPETVYSSTLSISAPGLYRFSMQAFYRAASNANTQAMHTARADFPPVVLFFGDSETQIKSLYDEEGGTTPYVEGNDAQYNDMYYANNMDAALMMFQEGKYRNDVWFYAPEAGTYEYGVKYLGHANANAQWFIYSPEAVTVTYYGTGTISTQDGIVKVLGTNEVSAINAALTSDIAVLNLENATGLNGAAISTENNSNLLIYAKATSQVASSVKNVIVNSKCNNLVLSKQSTPFFVPKAFTANNAKYTVDSRDLAGGKFATLMIPFAARVPTDNAYTLDQGVNTLGGEVKATKVTTVPANSPVLITGYGTFEAEANDINIPVIERGATYTSGELTGVYSTTQAPVGSYVLQNHASSPNGVAFYRVADTQPNVGPFRAYIKAQGSSVKSRALYINFGGDANGIATLDAEGNVSLSSAEYYTAGGTRLSAPQKGLNIVKYDNGTVKKIFVK
jgi:hypothetical protein